MLASVVLLLKVTRDGASGGVLWRGGRVVRLGWGGRGLGGGGVTGVCRSSGNSFFGGGRGGLLSVMSILLLSDAFDLFFKVP